jgi:hypothetical protein
MVSTSVYESNSETTHTTQHKMLISQISPVHKSKSSRLAPNLIIKDQSTRLVRVLDPP